jgi:hypothetical protein
MSTKHFQNIKNHSYRNSKDRNARRFHRDTLKSTANIRMILHANREHVDDDTQDMR